MYLLAECVGGRFGCESGGILLERGFRIKPLFPLGTVAIVAATAIFLGIPLLTFDAGFAKITDLDLILLEM